jgi:hypothetical protein
MKRVKACLRVPVQRLLPHQVHLQEEEENKEDTDDPDTKIENKIEMNDEHTMRICCERRREKLCIDGTRRAERMEKNR